ncbi:MAG: hypothetical protein ACJ75H_24130 [Thermoanaerobaculia bacterium]
MRKVSSLLTSLLLAASVASAAPAPGGAGRIERRLDSLATSFAKILQDSGARELLRSQIAASESGDGVRLRALLDLGIAPAKSRDTVLRTLGNTPDVDVSVLPGLEALEASAEAPLVAYVWEGAGGEERETVRAFDAAGAVVTLDTRQPLQRPVVLLEVHDTRRAVETAGAGEAGRVPVQEKLFEVCTDNPSYHSYPLITGSQIWDAHESSLNGPKGFLYFSAAGNEKTGNLPSTLGGLSGWSTNVWASNFQGPWLVSSSRDQWEWTADSWLETGYRTYPALYCQQTASTPSAFSLAAYTIKEDDDNFNADDYVGKSQIDHRYCKSDVFDLGTANGWSSQHSTSGIDDIISTTYKLYCTTNQNCSVSTECPNGSTISCSGSGTCSEGSCIAGDGWVQCGSYYLECPRACPNHQIICDPA